MTEQLELPGLCLPQRQAHRGPVAIVRLDLPAAHLDQEFDYALSPKLAAKAQLGQRITARFGATDRPGFIVGLADGSEYDGELRELRSIVSTLPVLTEEILHVATEVAGHYAGGVQDVLRLAVPPRHARTENSLLERISGPCEVTVPAALDPTLLQGYPGAENLLAQLSNGLSPTATWQALPGMVATQERISADIVQLVTATAASGRPSIVVVPAARQVATMCSALQAAGFNAITYGSTQSLAQRYRSFLLALLGQVDVVVGTRSAAWAPLPNLGLTVVIDESDPLLRERHTPQPQVWRIALARQGATVFCSYGQSLQSQLLVERGLAVSVRPSREALRADAPRVVLGDSTDMPTNRISAVGFSIVREALTHGPVLFLVPRAGYLNLVRCHRCGGEVRCSMCAAPVTVIGTGRMRCQWAGHITTQFSCSHCGSQQYRAGVIGSERSAEELGRAFPGTVIRVSGARTGIIETVSDRPAIVVATPGAAPIAPGGFQAGVVLDVSVLTSRAELSATAHAITQLASVWARIKPASAGGRFVILGRPDPAVAQTLIRADFSRAAATMLAERAQLHLPPLACVAQLTGPRGTLRAEVAAMEDIAAGMEVLGPTSITESTDRLLIRVPPAGAVALRLAMRSLIRRRSARGEPTISVTMDPVDL